jgi:hypothetical protein
MNDKFPIILRSNILSEEDFNSLIEEHKDYILHYFQFNRLLEEKLQTHLVEIETLREENLDLKNIVDLNEKQQGTHSMYKGEFEEKKKELILKEYFGNDFQIDGEKKMNCMDIRMNQLDKGYTIGIECKDKKTLTKNDMEKFKCDKLTNKFKGSVFISVSCPIKKKSEEKNSYKLINDELYIYSSDVHYIIILLKIFVTLTESERIENTEKLTDTIMNMYQHWTAVKKACHKMDTSMVEHLQDLGLQLTNGHLYLVSKTNCKKSKSPYGVDTETLKKNDLDTEHRQCL